MAPWGRLFQLFAPSRGRFGPFSIPGALLSRPPRDAGVFRSLRLAKWTDERRLELRRLWDEGRSSGEISKLFGDVSRNAVMGMVDRMGLMGSAGHAAAQERRGVRMHGAAARSTVASAMDVVSVVEADAVADAPAVAEALAVAEAIVAIPLVEAEPETATEVEIQAEVEVEAASTGELVAEASASESLVPVEDDTLPVSTPSVDVSATAASAASPSSSRRRAVVPPAPPAPVDRLEQIRRAARMWQAKSGPSRMPPARRETPPPGEVRLEGGVMSSLRRSVDGVPRFSEAMDALRRLTGVPYDQRVAGHLPALVAIATVMSGGDPRPMLEPGMPPQTVLRVMRVFAERGMVVAGKPSSSWIGDVDDRSFYDDMVAIRV